MILCIQGRLFTFHHLKYVCAFQIIKITFSLILILCRLKLRLCFCFHKYPISVITSTILSTYLFFHRLLPGFYPDHSTKVASWYSPQSKDHFSVIFPFSFTASGMLPKVFLKPSSLLGSIPPYPRGLLLTLCYLLSGLLFFPSSSQIYTLLRDESLVSIPLFLNYGNLQDFNFFTPHIC